MSGYSFNGHLIPYESAEIQRKKDIEYLLGADLPGSGRLTGNFDKNRLPMLATPFTAHLQEVNRFLFDGGLSIDVIGAEANDPRQDFLDEQIRYMRLSSKLQDIWKTGAITGEIFATYQLAKDSMGEYLSKYKVKFFDRSEYTPVYDDYGNLTEVKVFALYSVDGEEKVLKINYKPGVVERWPLMSVQEALRKNLPAPDVFPHPYKEVPGVIIRNKESVSCSTGLPEFDAASIDMATEIAIAICDAASNYHYFGDPKILSPDPVGTLKEIRSRAQVMYKDDELAAGKPEYMQMQPVPSDHPQFLEMLTQNLRKHLGSPIPDTKGGAELSSLTLRIMNAATISTAEARWQTYVEDGLRPLFEKLLIASAYDGILGNVTPLDPDTHALNIKRKRPYFPQTPAERQQAINNADSLIMLGVSKEVALSEEVYTELTAEQVQERLEGDL